MRQNSAIFGGRPIGTFVEALLMKVVNWQSSILPIVVFCSRRCQSNNMTKQR
jgi:hypothetical protein